MGNFKSVFIKMTRTVINKIMIFRKGRTPKNIPKIRAL
jgi:hypothetical protein